MRAIALLAANFVRSQWLAVSIMTGYVLSIGAVFGWHGRSPEVLFFFRQQAFYALFFSVLIAVPAVHAERKSRRILAVLSKGIHRWQYLAGLFFGCVAIAGFFCLLVGLVTLLLGREADLPLHGTFTVLLVLFAACMAGVAVALFCSVFLHPLLALIAAFAILMAPLAVELAGSSPPSVPWSPVSAIASVISKYQFQTPGNTIYWFALSAVVHAAVFMAGAALLFQRQDVTISPE